MLAELPAARIWWNEVLDRPTMVLRAGVSCGVRADKVNTFALIVCVRHPRAANTERNIYTDALHSLGACCTCRSFCIFTRSESREAARKAASCQTAMQRCKSTNLPIEVIVVVVDVEDRCEPFGKHYGPLPAV